jgi:hypothetical protein
MDVQEPNQQVEEQPLIPHTPFNTKLLVRVVILFGVLVTVGAGAYFYLVPDITIEEFRPGRSEDLSDEDIKAAKLLLSQNGYNADDFYVRDYGPYEQCRSDLRSREGVSPETKFCRVLQSGDEMCTYYKEICQTSGIRIDALRLYGGLPFFEGASITFLFSEDGTLKNVPKDPYYPVTAEDINISTKPKISEREAVRALKTTKEFKLGYAEAQGYSVSLGILPRNPEISEEEYTLVWKIKIIGTPHFAYIDARTGEVVIFYYFIE